MASGCSSSGPRPTSSWSPRRCPAASIRSIRPSPTSGPAPRHGPPSRSKCLSRESPMTSRRIKPAFVAAAVIAAAAMALALPGAAQDAANDYPTDARADYVFGCMEVNGGTQEALRRCSCSIDVIATILPYDKYVEAETVMSVVQVGGEKAAMFHDPSMSERVADLRRAQAEGEIRCF